MDCQIRNRIIGLLAPRRPAVAWGSIAFTILEETTNKEECVMKNTIKLLGIIAIAVIGFSMAACSDDSSDTSSGGGSFTSTITGPRYVYSKALSSSITQLYTFKFAQNPLVASGIGVAYVEKFNTATKELIPFSTSKSAQCTFSYTYNATELTGVITWTGDAANDYDSEAHTVAWEFVIAAFDNPYYESYITYAKTTDILTNQATWEYKE